MTPDHGAQAFPRDAIDINQIRHIAWPGTWRLVRTGRVTLLSTPLGHWVVDIAFCLLYLPEKRECDRLLCRLCLCDVTTVGRRGSARDQALGLHPLDALPFGTEDGHVICGFCGPQNFAARPLLALPNAGAATPAPNIRDVQQWRALLVELGMVHAHLQASLGPQVRIDCPGFASAGRVIMRPLHVARHAVARWRALVVRRRARRAMAVPKIVGILRAMMDDA